MKKALIATATVSALAATGIAAYLINKKRKEDTEESNKTNPVKRLHQHRVEVFAKAKNYAAKHSMG